MNSDNHFQFLNKFQSSSPKIFSQTFQYIDRSLCFYSIDNCPVSGLLSSDISTELTTLKTAPVASCKGVQGLEEELEKYGTPFSLEELKNMMDNTYNIENSKFSINKNKIRNFYDFDRQIFLKYKLFPKVKIKAGNIKTNGKTGYKCSDLDIEKVSVEKEYQLFHDKQAYFIDEISIQNINKLPLFLTVTVPDEYFNESDSKEQADRLKAFVRQVFKRFPSDYFYCLEPQKRGAVHLHMVLFIKENELDKFINYIDGSIKRRGFGRSHMMLPKGVNLKDYHFINRRIRKDNQRIYEKIYVVNYDETTYKTGKYLYLTYDKIDFINDKEYQHLKRDEKLQLRVQKTVAYCGSYCAKTLAGLDFEKINKGEISVDDQIKHSFFKHACGGKTYNFSRLNKNNNLSRNLSQNLGNYQDIIITKLPVTTSIYKKYWYHLKQGFRVTLSDFLKNNEFEHHKIELLDSYGEVINIYEKLYNNKLNIYIIKNTVKPIMEQVDLDPDIIKNLNPNPLVANKIQEDNKQYQADLFSNNSLNILDNINKINSHNNFNKEQKDALLKVLRVGSNLITGAAGTGKSYVMAEFADILGMKTSVITLTHKLKNKWIDGCRNNLNFKNTNFDTVDNFLKVSVLHGQYIMPDYKYLRRDVKNTEILIVDEVFMLPSGKINLINDFIKLNKNLKAVIFLGDSAQIKQCEFSYPEVSKLTVNMRSNNKVINMAHKILNDDFSDIKHCGNLLFCGIQDYVDQGYVFLAETCKEVRNINALCYTNNYIMMKNTLTCNYLSGKFFKITNGTLLKLVKTTDKYRYFEVMSGEYTGEQIRFFEFENEKIYQKGICQTVNKAQGSEYDKVIYITSRNVPKMGTDEYTKKKEKAYTAITRAKIDIKILAV